jgi:formate-nitrite transporter family protein
MPKETEFPLKPGRTILEQESADALIELERPLGGLFLSALIAGFSVGTGILVMAAVMTFADGEISELTLRLLLANAYAIGFIIVVMSHTDLFTEYTTMALLPAFSGEASYRAVARLWIIVYVANLIAATAFAALAATLGTGLQIADPTAFRELALKMLDHGTGTIVLSAVLAGWLMGVMSWLVSSGRDTTSQVLFVWLIGLTIALLGLHHCITGTIQVMLGLFAGETVTLGDFARMLAWTTLGNVIGGFAFAAIIRYSVIVSRAA